MQFVSLRQPGERSASCLDFYHKPVKTARRTLAIGGAKMRHKQIFFLILVPLFGLTSCTAPPAPTLRTIDQFTQAPVVEHVSPGAVVELWAGNPGSLTLVATSGPANSGSTIIRVPLPSRLSPGQIVRARQKTGFAHMRKSGFSPPVVVEDNYVTNRYDNERSGWNPNETTLTVSAVRNRLEKVCERLVDAPIRAQPLYVQDLDIPGKGKHNVVFVATEGDKIWAFDADSCPPNNQPLWGPRSLLGAGENAPGTGNVPAKCGLKYGVWSTPVIDRTTDTMYAVAAIEKGTAVFFRLYAIDIHTGQDRATPAVMDGTTVQFTHGNITAVLDPSVQQNRPGLLLDRGVVYLAFGSCGDEGAPYHGWVLAYDADLPGSSTYLKQLGVFNTSPTATGGCNTLSGSPPCFAGIWQSGLGLAAAGDGTVYLITGNGKFDYTTGWYGNPLLRLRLPPAGSSNKQMQIVSFFTPYDWQTTYEFGDQDFGSGGPVLFTSGSRHFVLAGGKPPKGYLIDRDCTSCNGAPNWCNPAAGQACTGDNPNLVLQTVMQPHGVVAGPAYYIGPRGMNIYYGYNYSPITAFSFQSNPPLITNPQVAPDSAPVTSPIPTVSSNGASPGTGVVWAVFHPAGSGTLKLTLHAYDADNIADNLFSSSAQGSLDVGPWTSGTVAGNLGNSFQVPSVIHGRVYCGSEDRLVVFGIRRRPSCSLHIDCGGSVTFHCPKYPGFEALQLQRKQGASWKTVTDSSSMRDITQFVQLWDYAPGDTAVYRVCSTTHPEECTQEFAPKVSHVPCGLDAQCGRVGKPPCFLYKPWPVEPGEGGPETRAQRH